MEKSPQLIQESFERLINQTNNTAAWGEVSEIFNTCTTINETSDFKYLYLHLSNGYQYMAMTDYPYNTSFLEPMPGFPVNVSAAMYTNVSTDGASDPTAAVGEPLTARDNETLKALAASTGVYFNYTG